MLTGKNAYEYSFRKKDQVVTLACKTAVRLNDGDVQVDLQLMFQRLSIVAAATTGGFESPQQLFEYEMCGFPASLFDVSLLPLKANKPVLADAIWSTTKESQTANDPGRSAYFVIDGGALLHRVVWPRGLTYNHREHTILLNRERVNKGTERMNSLTFSSCHLFYLTRYLLGNLPPTNPA